MAIARRILVLAALALFAATACTPSIPQDPQPDTVRAIWDPVAGTLPSPTDLVRDANAEHLDVPLDDGLPPAELEFRRYLNSLDGFPLQSSISIPVSDPVDSATLGGALVVFDTATNSSLQVATPQYDEASGLITTHAPFDGPDSSLQPGHEYVFGLRGYEGGVVGEHGEPVVADAPFYFVRAHEPLTDHPSALPGATRAERRDNAAALEAVRQRYLPLYDALSQRGIPRDQIAVASSFTTTKRPSVWFDPVAKKIPIPSGLLIDDDTGKVDLPADPADDPETQLLKETLSGYDGLSMSGALVLEATGPVDPTSVTPETVRLFRVDDDGRVAEKLDLDYGVLEDRTHFWIKPHLHIEPSSNYVYVVTRGVMVDGRPVEPQPVSALLRSKAPLYEDGAPQVSSLDGPTAELLERWRTVAKPAVDWLDDQGVPRDSLSAVVPFRTASSTSWMMKMRAKLYTDDVPTDVTSVVTKTPLERGLPLVLDNVETVTTGKMTIADRLDPRTRRFRADGPRPNQIDFVLTVPIGYDSGEPIPVVLFGHGLFTSRDLVYMIANKLADGGFAAFSIDLPYHGRRSVCMSDDDCTAGNCDELGRCQGGEIKTVKSPWPDGPEWPITTGMAFIQLDNIVGARDHFIQSVLDLQQGLRVVRNADWSKATGGYVLDGDDVVYLGMSLGGIVGAMLAGVEPTIQSFALNVPGGNFFQLITDSKTFESLFQQALDARGIERGSDDYFTFENGIRWLFDPIDPINLAPDAMRSFTWVDPRDGQEKQTPVKRILIEMCQDDQVVPNSATHSLSDATGVPIRKYTPSVSNHAFLFDPTSLEGARARNDILDFFADR